MRRTSVVDPVALNRRLAARTLWSERLIAILTLVALVLGHGVTRLERQLETELGVLVAVVMALLTAGLAWRAWLSDEPWTFAAERLPQVAVHVVWIALLPLVALLGIPGIVAAGSPLEGVLEWSELAFWARAVTVALRLLRMIAAARTNPAIVFVGSFALLIAVGTFLLMLPVARAQPAESQSELRAPPLVALFTATSASCVTGLIVVDTSGYWSRTGQLIILGLIQLGGLGIMTFGAFYALGQRRGFLLRESVFMGKLLEAGDVQAVRRLIRSILVFTLLSEAVGAVLLMSLAPPGTLSERLYFGAFHSISSFCNAGFTLLPKNLEGMGGLWQVWGVVGGLIIVGGLGFDVLRNASGVLIQLCLRRWPGRKAQGERSIVRLTATSRLALLTTLCLLISGTLAFFILENDNTLDGKPLGERVGDSWFQSVAFRTAGFNSVDVTRLNPGTRLIGIVLMFIGASPGSTGGGIKTVAFAVLVLATSATVQGRSHIEVGHREISEVFIRRAAVIMGMALTCLLSSTLLIVILEQRPDLFLDHLFECTSALGTVGLSTLGSHNFRPASQLVLIATMFAGRVGPLTILVALARQRPDQKYAYPSERVTLG